MYKIQIYVNTGYFEYTVKEMQSAIEHAQVILERGVYRRVNDRKELEFYKVIKVKVLGEGLESQYMDEFKRT